jgi:hypothetical protein
MERAKARQPVHQKPLRKGGRHTEGDTPLRPPTRQSLRAERDHRQAFGDVREQVATSRRQGDPAGTAPKQLDAEPFLERIDAVTDGAGGQPELLGGFAEAFVAGGGFEQAKRRQRRHGDRHECRLTCRRCVQTQRAPDPAPVAYCAKQ